VANSPRDREADARRQRGVTASLEAKYRKEGTRTAGTMRVGFAELR
jgi:hypothetical protein